MAVASGSAPFRSGSMPTPSPDGRGRRPPPLVKRMRASMGERALIIGVDRLDYSKGIRQRIEAFSCFIRSNPQFRNRVTYLQVTPKSRSEVPEYRRCSTDRRAGRMGERHLGEVDWTPIRYVNRSIGHAALAGLYRLARSGW